MLWGHGGQGDLACCEDMVAKEIEHVVGTHCTSGPRRCIHS